MKITGIESTVVAVPLKVKYSSSLGSHKTITSILVKVKTDEGITGIGESPSVFHADATVKMIDIAREILIGADPLEVDVLKKKLYAKFNLIHFHIHAANWALSGIEIALWDLIGKKAGLPIYKLWGGAFRKDILYWGWVAGNDLKEAVKETRRLVDEGFTTLYTKVGVNPEDDVDLVKTIRDTCGYGNIKLRVDANQAWSTSGAINIIKKMEKYDLEFVEQPVLMYAVDALADVRRAVNVPILAHESTWTFYDVLNVIKKNAADSIQIDPRFDAGFTGARIAAGMAEAAGMSSILHSYGELGVAATAAMHLVASSPSFIHANQTYNDNLSDDVIKEKLIFRDGHIRIPEGPGLGVSLNEKKVTKYAHDYATNIAHKEVTKDWPKTRNYKDRITPSTWIPMPSRY